MKELNLRYNLSWQDKNFIKLLPKKLKQISTEKHKETREMFIEIFNNEDKYIQDKQSQSFYIICSYIAAYYDCLRSESSSSKDRIMDQLSNSLIKSTGGKYVTLFTKIVLKIKRDKRKSIEQSSLQSKKSFGKFLTMTEEKDKDSFTSIISKCGIYDFSKRRKIPELTLVFCKWDNLWANEINKQNCGIKFKRPTTIANNDDDCRFEFHYF